MIAMLRIVIEVNAPPYMAHAIKEDLAMYTEQRGDCRVVSIEEISQKFDQTKMKMPGSGRDSGR